MSAVPRHPADTEYFGLRMTADEYLALGETRDRYELIDGVVVMSPSPTPRHQKVARLLLREIERYADARPACEVFYEIDLRLSDTTVYRPDIVVYAPGRLERLPERLAEAPDLVVEVLSVGTRALDLSTKRADYARFGVAEYWVIDPVALVATVHRRAGSGYAETGIGSGRLASAALPGLSVDLDALRARLGA
jgi:Uma2 family endonuclease